MLGAELTLAVLLFAGKDPARLLGLERLYFSAASDPGKGAFHAEEVRRLLPGSLPRGASATAGAAAGAEVTVRDVRLPVGGPAREIVLRDVHDVSNRIAAQWWCLYDDGHREGCWFFAPAPIRTEGKLLADYRIESAEAVGPDRLVLHTAGATIRPQGAFWLQGKDLVFGVAGATLRLDHVLGRYEVSRGYAVGSNEGPLSVATEAAAGPDRLVTRTMEGVSPAEARRCGFRDLDAAGPEPTSAAIERAALCMTADAGAGVSERARSAPSFVEQGGQRAQARAPARSPVRALARQGRCTEAEAAGRAALTAADGRTPRDPLAAAAILDDLLDAERACFAPERSAEARAWGERAVALREAAQGQDAPALGESLIRLGRVLVLGAGDGPAALAVYERALAILDKAYGPDDPRLASLWPGMQKAVDKGGTPPSAGVLALKARAAELTERLRALEDERLARAWRTVDRVEVSRLDTRAAPARGPGFPVDPDGGFARIVETKEVPEGKRAGFLASWQAVQKDQGAATSCARPAYGLRFLHGDEPILETTLSFECPAVAVPLGTEPAWRRLGADRDAVDDLQARLEALFVRP